MNKRTKAVLVVCVIIFVIADLVLVGRSVIHMLDDGMAKLNVNDFKSYFGIDKKYDITLENIDDNLGGMTNDGSVLFKVMLNSDEQSALVNEVEWLDFPIDNRFMSDIKFGNPIGHHESGSCNIPQIDKGKYIKYEDYDTDLQIRTGYRLLIYDIDNNDLYYYKFRL